MPHRFSFLAYLLLHQIWAIFNGSRLSVVSRDHQTWSWPCVFCFRFHKHEAQCAPRQGADGTQYCASCDKTLAYKANMILHLRTVHRADSNNLSDDKSEVISCVKHWVKNKTELSNFSFCSRLSSLPSSSSASSGSTSSSSLFSQSSISTDLFWNQSRRKQEDCSFVTNIIILAHANGGLTPRVCARKNPNSSPPP
jgi:hypothetical protein